jgi:hypothetical protein
MKNIITAVLLGATLFVDGCSQHQKSDADTLQGTWKGKQIRIEHQCSLIISGKNYDFQDDADTNAWDSQNNRNAVSPDKKVNSVTHGGSLSRDLRA